MQLKVLPNALVMFLMAVDWLNPEEVAMVIEILPEWSLPEKAEEFVPFLDVRFHNEFVRCYAVK